ncbi:MAG: hypothetical protein J0H89_01965 [Rhizobiales bacterium]|nr:hypothetical protein [Hyphomicrobiales bacterium]
MLTYAGVLLLARYFRLRDDQAGDNLYYLGFLYTLTSLGVSLFQFSVTDGGAGIVTNFGIAIATTILGIALRVMFNQMRQDPVEVEAVARLELADAARKIRQEIDGASLEFASFRRTITQMLEEAAKEQRAHSERFVVELFDKLADIPQRTAEPLALASKQTRERIETLAEALIERLKETGQIITKQEETLATSTQGVSSSLRDLESRFKAVQTPESVIEVKLQPFIQGFTKAVNNQAKATESQTIELKSAIDAFNENVKALSSQLMASEQKQASDQQAAREIVVKAQEDTAETRRLLAELARSLQVPPAVAPEPVSESAEPSRGWSLFRGGRA